VELSTGEEVSGVKGSQLTGYMTAVPLPRISLQLARHAGGVDR